MASTKDQNRSMFEVVDIREVPDKQLEDLLGGAFALMSPQMKMI